MPDNEQNDYQSYRNARMKAATVRVGLLEVLGKLAAIGLYVRLVFRCLTALDLFLTLGFSHKTVEFVLSLGSIDMDAMEAPRFTCLKEGHMLLMKNEQ